MQNVQRASHWSKATWSWFTISEAQLPRLKWINQLIQLSSSLSHPMGARVPGCKAESVDWTLLPETQPSLETEEPALGPLVLLKVAVMKKMESPNRHLSKQPWKRLTVAENRKSTQQSLWMLAPAAEKPVPIEGPRSRWMPFNKDVFFSSLKEKQSVQKQF